MCALTPRDRSRRPDSASRHVLAWCRYIVYSHISTQPRGGFSLLARKSSGERGKREDQRAEQSLAACSVYGCHMELRQRNNGSNVGEPPPPLVHPAFSRDDTLPSHAAHTASGCVRTGHIGRKWKNPALSPRRNSLFC